MRTLKTAKRPKEVDGVRKVFEVPESAVEYEGKVLRKFGNCRKY